jgi:hypothetical protein
MELVRLKGLRLCPVHYSLLQSVDREDERAVTMRAGYWYYWVHGTESSYRLLGRGSGWAGRNLRSRPTRASVYWRVWSPDTRLSDLLCPIFASWILPGRCRWRTTPGRSQNRRPYLPDSLCSLAGIPRNHAEQSKPEQYSVSR